MPDEHDVPTYSAPAGSRPSQGVVGFIAPAALVLALVATGLAAWALIRSPGESGAEQSAQSSDDAKEEICTAFTKVQRAVSLQTNINLGPDPVAREAVAANARLATTAGGEYLLARLDPGTPSELADAIRTFANNLVDVGMNQLAGAGGNPAQTELMNQTQELSVQITEMCK